MDKTDETCQYLRELLAQRQILTQSFFSYKHNLDGNTRSIKACLRLLKKASGGGLEEKKQLAFFQTENADELVSAIHQACTFKPDDILLLLQLILSAKPALTAGVVDKLGQSQVPALQFLSAQLILTLGGNNGQGADLHIFLRIADKGSYSAYHLILLAGYYHNILGQVLAAVINEAPDEVFQNPPGLEYYIAGQPPLSQLYLKVLFSAGKDKALKEGDCLLLLKLFIECEYLSSHLFEIFILSLGEESLTRVINQLSSALEQSPDSVDRQQGCRQPLEESLIFAMALSGYSKFIPFLARYLQSPIYKEQAFTGLRLLLGDKLDLFIPPAIQFNSDEAQRLTDLSYYGAKILGCWQSVLTTGGLSEHQQEQTKQKAEISPRLFNGLPPTVENIESILLHGSLVHRRYACLHKRILIPEQACPHYLSVVS